MPLRAVRIVVGMLCLGLVASCGGNTDSETPLIFAAASLADVLTESADIYQSETGNKVEFSFGGSLALANQIAKFGAPADGALLAGADTIEILRDGDLVTEHEPFSPITNSLVVVGAKEEAPWASLMAANEKAGTIAIGDPALAPAGGYARQALQSAGVWNTISDRLILSLDVRAAMAAVESGNARFGIVYKTDALTADAVTILYEIIEDHDPVVYLPVPVSGATNRTAGLDFLRFLTENSNARSILERAGFSLLK